MCSDTKHEGPVSVMKPDEKHNVIWFLCHGCDKQVLPATWETVTWNAPPDPEVAHATLLAR